MAKTIQTCAISSLPVRKGTPVVIVPLCVESDDVSDSRFHVDGLFKPAGLPIRGTFDGIGFVQEPQNAGVCAKINAGALTDGAFNGDLDPFLEGMKSLAFPRAVIREDAWERVLSLPLQTSDNHPTPAAERFATLSDISSYLETLPAAIKSGAIGGRAGAYLRSVNRYSDLPVDEPLKATFDALCNELVTQTTNRNNPNFLAKELMGFGSGGSLSFSCIKTLADLIAEGLPKDFLPAADGLLETRLMTSVLGIVRRRWAPGLPVAGESHDPALRLAFLDAVAKQPRIAVRQAISRSFEDGDEPWFEFVDSSAIVSQAAHDSLDSAVACSTVKTRPAVKTF